MGTCLLSLIRNNIAHVIGNGNSTFFWNETWVKDSPLNLAFPDYTLSWDKRMLLLHTAEIRSMRHGTLDWGGIFMMLRSRNGPPFPLFPLPIGTTRQRTNGNGSWKEQGSSRPNLSPSTLHSTAKDIMLPCIKTFGRALSQRRFWYSYQKGFMDCICLELVCPLSP